MSVNEQIPEQANRTALMGAIADLRQTLHRLINEQRTLIRGWEPDAMACPAPAPPPILATVVSPLPPSTLPTPPPAADLPNAARNAMPQAKPVPAPAELPVPVAIAVEVAAVEGRPADPRQRLDALAKLLSKRLKPAAGAVVNPGDA